MLQESPIFKFGPELIGKLFPFHVAFDRRLCVVQFGNSLKKVCEGVSAGQHFAELFSISRPKLAPTFEALQRASTATFFLQSVSKRIRMRGQIVYEPESDLLVFVGAPWFTDLDELEATGLQLQDFTVADSIVDFLYMVRAKSLALADAQQFSETVIKQRDEIERTNQHLKQLSTSIAEANTALSAALERAEESTRLKSEFLANISHELRTPLNAIINIPDGILDYFSKQRMVRCSVCNSLFELEAEESFDAQTACPACEPGQNTLRQESHWSFTGAADRTVDLLQLVKRSGAHLLAVINDLLDISKLEVGKMTLYCETIYLAGLLKEVASTLQTLTTERNIKVSLLPIETSLNLYGDPIKCTQILSNLLHNAIKFSPDGGNIEVGAKADGPAVLIWVRDYGIGLASEHHSLIFESFRQVDSGNTRRYGGSGLGLAITKRLVELHGGSIWVESELGKGSTFYVRLPLRASESANLPKPETVSSAAMTSPALAALLQTGTVLVIDDDPTVLATAELLLQACGCKVVCTTNPSKTLELMETVKPDLLILDVIMPGLDGGTVLRRLAETPGHRCPVLVSSAHPDNEHLARSLRAHWVSKPWDRKTIVEFVASLLNRRDILAVI